MSGLTWLHLSDWHQKGKDFDRTVVRDALMKDIKDRAVISTDLSKIDFAVFSGDVTYHGTVEEYQTAIDEFFNPLLEASGVERNRLFIVPGNHDLEWNALELLPSDLLDKLNTPGGVNRWLTDERKRRTLLEPMADYTQFILGYLDGSADGFEPAFGCVYRFDVESKAVAVIGLNSAWLSARHKETVKGKEEVNDYGYLVVGEPQVYEALKQAYGADLLIAVMHHPFDWLMTTDVLAEKSLIRDRLGKGCHFFLHGHEHEPNMRVSYGTSGDCVTISAGASYDRREPVASRYANGYSFVHLDFLSGRGIVYLRRYDDRQGWVRDTSTTGDKTPGYCSLRLPKSLGKSESLLDTESPLGDELIFTFEQVDTLSWSCALRGLIDTEEGKAPEFMAEGNWQDAHHKLQHVTQLGGFLEAFAVGNTQYGYLELYNYPNTYESVSIHIEHNQLRIRVTGRTLPQHRDLLKDKIMELVGGLDGVKHQVSAHTLMGSLPLLGAGWSLRERLLALCSDIDLPVDAPAYECLGNIVMHALGRVKEGPTATALQFAAVLILGVLWSWVITTEGLNLPVWALIGSTWLGLTVLPMIAGNFPQRQEEQVQVAFDMSKSQRFAVWLEKAFGIYVSAFLGEVAAVVLWLLLTYTGLWSRFSLGARTVFWFVMVLVTCFLSFIGSIIAVRYLWNLSKQGKRPRLHWQNALLGLGFPFIILPGMLFFGVSTAPIWGQRYQGGLIIAGGILLLAWMLRRESRR